MSTSKEHLAMGPDSDRVYAIKNIAMSVVIKWKRNWLLLLGVMLGFVLFYVISQTSVVDKMRISPYHVDTTGYSVWPDFQHKPVMDSAVFRSRCAPNGNYSITGLVDMKKQWSRSRVTACQELYDKFASIFTLEARKAPLSLPGPFQGKVKKWLGNNEELYKEVFNQDVIHVVSEYTREHTVFNPLRDKRPVSPPDEPEQEYFDHMLRETAKSCDFCKFKDFTAEHTFGRVESKHAFSASNVFKVDTLHALLAFKKHDPIHWTYEEFMDLFDLTKQWMSKAHNHYPRARFPSLIWDVLPKCGASQVHPHLHVVQDFERHHGEVEAWRKGAQDYYSSHHSNYFSDVVAIYSALNLTATYGKAVAFASLVPKKDHEIVVMAKEPDTDFFTLLYFVLRGLIDDVHKMCFSMGVGIPGINEPKGRIPAYARVITRGFITDIRADISSLELFMATNVNIDPYKTIEIVRNSMRQRSGRLR